MWVRTFFIFVFIAVGISKPQYHEYSAQSGVGIPFFKLMLHQQYESDLMHTKLLMMTELIYDDLTFLKSDTTGFDAEFEILFAIYDESDAVVVSRVVNKKINTLEFENTNRRNKQVYHQESLSLLPGKYKVFVKAVDINSDKVAQRKIDITVADFSKKELNINTPLFIQKIESDSLNRLLKFVPSFGNNFTVSHGEFYIHFDLFHSDLSKPVKVHYRIYHDKKKTEIDTTFILSPDKMISSHIIKIDKNSLKYNKYNLEIDASSGNSSSKRTQIFSFYWSEVPGTTEDINEALMQMAYILSQDSLSKYRKSEFEEQKVFFKRFWDERDPDPQTSRNELKNEYFKRVNYSIQHFTSMGIDGWKTDRGRILIKFGYPDDIERHPFEIDRKPYEVWRYYALRKTFYFIDISGFGDYQLHPDFLDVEFQ